MNFNAIWKVGDKKNLTGTKIYSNKRLIKSPVGGIGSIILLIDSNAAFFLPVFRVRNGHS